MSGPSVQLHHRTPSKAIAIAKRIGLQRRALLDSLDYVYAAELSQEQRAALEAYDLAAERVIAALGGTRNPR